MPEVSFHFLSPHASKRDVSFFSFLGAKKNVHELFFRFSFGPIGAFGPKSHFLTFLVYSIFAPMSHYGYRFYEKYGICWALDGLILFFDSVSINLGSYSISVPT